MVLYKGRTFLEHSLNLLLEVGLKPVVVTRKEADYSFLSSPVLKDKLSDMGPLGGIYTAMSVFRNTDFLVLTCDMPALTPVALSDLLTAHESHFGITVYSVGSDIQPFPGIYDFSIFKIIRESPKQDSLSMKIIGPYSRQKRAVLERRRSSFP